MTIKEGSTVSLEYTLSLEDGTQIETSRGKDPMVYQQGKREIIFGLEKQLKGMKVGEKKIIKVKPEEAYGRVDSSAFVEVPRDELPMEALAVGTPLQAEDRKGNTIFMRVHEVKEAGVVLDLNHPLAGQTLFFDVCVLEVTQMGIGQESI
jgi:FKBP-type peptidyl-prolyl cis-trans isomerase 2